MSETELRFDLEGVSNRHALFCACHHWVQGRIKSNITPIALPKIPRSFAHANERKKGDKSELKGL